MKTLKKKFVKKDIYSDVTNSIIEQLENGVAPWVNGWDDKHASLGLPSNAISGNAYNGINVLITMMAAYKKGYEQNIWITYKQAKEIGGNVKKGEKGTSITFFKMQDLRPVQKDANGKNKQFPMIKPYSVFNIEQCENLDAKKIKNLEVKIKSKKKVKNIVLEIARKCGAKIKSTGNKAFYSLANDAITMPAYDSFESNDSYSSVLAHELTHWTGNAKRLDRDLSGSFGSSDYAFEELVAELSSAFVCASLNIELKELRHAAYIESWLKVLKEDKKAIFKAAKLAQQSTDFIFSESA